MLRPNDLVDVEVRDIAVFVKTHSNRIYTMDILLSLDPGHLDCLYRIQRVSGDVNRVVYITITNLNIIPEEKRTYDPSVIKELSKLKE